MSSAIDQLRQTHHENWSQVPSWSITTTTKDAAEQESQHSAELSQLQKSLEQASSNLNLVKSQLAETSQEKEEAVAKIGELQTQCAKLQADACEYQRKMKSQNEDDGGNVDDNDNEQKTHGDQRHTSSSSASPHQASAVALLKSQNEQLLKQVETLTKELTSASSTSACLQQQGTEPSLRP